MIRGGVLRWLVAALVCALALAALPARAQAGLAGSPIGVCVLRDSGHDDPLKLFASANRFDCNTGQEKFGAGDYWVLSQPLAGRSTVELPLRIRIASLWQKSLDLHILYADGHVESTHANSRGVARMIQLGAIVEQPIPPRAASVSRLLWHVGGSANVRGIVVGPRLATREQSERSNLMMGAIYAAFAGLSIALIIYNLALWAALRHRFQLVYCLMVALLLGYTLSSSGVLAWIVHDIDNNDRLRINYLLLSGSAAMALLFARTFFEERVYAGWLGHMAKVISGSILSAGVLFFFAAPFTPLQADTAFAYTFIGIVAVFVPTMWRAWRTRSNYLWLFAIAWAGPIAAAVLRELANAHMIPWNFWLDNSTILATAAEALLSSVAIAYRIRLLTRERDDAIAGEVIARRLADTDPLTGLLNRRAFLERAIGRSGPQHLLIADLDHFKHVNETLGHDGGDEVLRLFARILRTCTPAGALAARIGGEEFAIVADANQLLDPDIVLARLRGTRMPFDLTVTASIGSCFGPLASELDWKALYRSADTALFEAKAAGRDRARTGTIHARAA